MTVRHATVAGQFYPAGARQLREDVASYISASDVEAAPQRVVAMVAPHAGYVFSGPAAGYVFARAAGKKPKRVVVMGRSHRYAFDGAAVYTEGAFETPLGTLPIDEVLASELAATAGPGIPQSHDPEHSIEVQLPFVQVALGEVPIVPVLFGSDPDGWHLALGRRLAGLLDREDLVIASTDLSHFLREEEANEIDRRSLDRVLSKDADALCEELGSGRCSMCGGTAVAIAMAYAAERGANDWRLWDYRTSAAASGDYTRVVGYGAISMELDG